MADAKQAVIDELLERLEDLNRRVADTKRTINTLRSLMDQPPMFDEGPAERVAASRTIRSDQFFGRALSTAVREYIEMRGQAVPPAEIVEGLLNGGFDFDALGWGKNDRARIMSITLAKNSQTFVKLKSGAFGVRSMYPNLPALKKAPRTISLDPADAEDDEADLTVEAPEVEDLTVEEPEPRKGADVRKKK